MLIASDFQCPYCKLWHDETFAALRREYVETGKVRMAFVHFPLDNHAQAKPAAVAAMCASAQGKFWEYHTALFEETPRWSGGGDQSAVYEALAQRVGASVPAFRDCVRSGVMSALVEADKDRMLRAGVNSTPSFFVGNRAVAGAQPLPVFAPRSTRRSPSRAERPGGGRRMHPAVRPAYALLALAARAAARVAPDGEGKVARALRARRGVQRRFAAWAGAHRDVARPLLWLHAPSVGEGLQARPVLEWARRERPDVQRVYTFYSPSAERFARGLVEQGLVEHADYLPFDTAGDARACSTRCGRRRSSSRSSTSGRCSSPRRARAASASGW
jgi:predicted DsbA family dithiol-disulfide isomerase